MTAEKFKKHLTGLTDFELYSLAKKNIISAETGMNVFDWKGEMIYRECLMRHPDIYSAALNDAEMMIESRRASGEINISDIFRPSLMSRSEINRLLDGTIKAQGSIDVMNELVRSDSANYIMCKVSGDSMTGDGIFDNDILIVEKSAAADGKIIVASVNNALFVKRYRKNNEGEWLLSSNPDYPPVQISDDMSFRILGVVRYVMHSIK